MPDAKRSSLTRYIPKRLSLRTFFLLVTVLAIVIGTKINQKRNEERAVAAFLKDGGKVTYRHQLANRDPRLGWLGKLTGDYDVVEASIRVFTGNRPALEQLEHFAGLERLVLSGHEEVLIDDTLAPLRSLRRLKSLRIGSFGITDAGLAHLSELRQLEELEVSPKVYMESFGAGGIANPGNIGGEGLVHLKDLRQLRVLKLSENQISDDSLRHLRDLPLEELDLSVNTLNGTGIDHLATAKTTLHTLNLRSASLTIEGIKAIAKLSELKQLDVAMASNASGASALLSVALPNCKVIAPAARVPKAAWSRRSFGPPKKGRNR